MVNCLEKCNILRICKVICVLINDCRLFQRLNFTVNITNWWTNVFLDRAFDEWYLVHLNYFSHHKEERSQKEGT